MKFKLPDEDDEYELFKNANKYFLALCDLEEKLRQRWKYTEYETEKEYELIEKIREEFYDILNDNNVKLI